jgi:hypothetical protein
MIGSMMSHRLFSCVGKDNSAFHSTRAKSKEIAAMSFSVLSKSPHLPDSLGETVALLIVLTAIAILSYRLADWRVAVPLTMVALVGYLFDHQLFIPGAMVIALVATVTARKIRGEPLRQSGSFGASFRDVGVIAIGFLLYEFGRTLTEGNYDTAVANSERLIRVQDFLGLPDEARFQQWVFNHSWLVEPFNTIYSFFFLATTVGGLIWLSFNAPQVYRTARNAMGVATFSALAIFASIPMAPPRMVAMSGLADSHARVGLTHGYVNEFAAMPSLHVGWMALIGWALARAIGGTRGKLIGLVPPTVMMMTVVVTGHHFWMDGIVGSTLCVVPAMLIDRLPAGAGRRFLLVPIPNGSSARAASHSADEIIFLVAKDDDEVSLLEPAGSRRDSGDTRALTS